MPEPKEKQDPKEDNPQEDPKKDSSTEEQSKETHIENQDDLPEKFKGKSANDIAKSYLELEKKLGENATNSKKHQEELEQWRTLGNIIKEDPELVKALEAKVGKQEANNKPNDDTRDALSNQIVNDFERKYGIDSLEGEKRSDLHKRIGQELADMLDPGGVKSTREILEGINLSRLPQYLDKAYRLATLNDEAEQARMKGYIEARRNSEATFGSIPSTGSRGDSNTLTPDERATAKKLGISEEKYLKQKKALEE